MKYINHFFKKIKIIDVVIVVVLFIALGIAGYAHLEKAGKIQPLLGIVNFMRRTFVDLCRYLR